MVGRYGQFTQGFVEPLENCAMIGGTIQGTSSMGQSSCVGGIVGRACGEIQRCYATGNIIGADNAIEYGGIVGESFKTVNACYSTGRLSALGSYADDFGGIAGSARGAVTNCYTTGDITGSLNNAGTLGSIVGCALDRVTNCYATGSVKGWRAIGRHCRTGVWRYVCSCDDFGLYGIEYICGEQSFLFDRTRCGPYRTGKRA